jgi:hypothetical protein
MSCLQTDIAFYVFRRQFEGREDLCRGHSPAFLPLITSDSASLLNPRRCDGEIIDFPARAAYTGTLLCHSGFGI